MKRCKPITKQYRTNAKNGSNIRNSKKKRITK